MNLSNQLYNSSLEKFGKDEEDIEEDNSSFSKKFRNDKFWMSRKNKNKMKKRSRVKNRK